MALLVPATCPRLPLLAPKNPVFGDQVQVPNYLFVKLAVLNKCSLREAANGGPLEDNEKSGVVSEPTDSLPMTCLTR